MGKGEKKNPPSAESASDSMTTTQLETEDDTNFAEFIKKNDVKKFEELCKLTGQLQGNLEDLDLRAQKEFQSAFYQWIKAGKPKPEMPKIAKAVVAAPVLLGRIISRGKEMMYWNTSDSIKHGRKFKEGTNEVYEYTEVYDRNKAAKLVSEAEKLNGPEINVGYYIHVGVLKYTLNNGQDFLRSFDEVAQEIRDGKYKW